MNDTVQTHYDAFLAPIYSWLSGGFDEQAKKNRQFFMAHGIRPRGSGMAVDFGAGNGFQAVPLADLGFSVTAVDSCRSLLDELSCNAASLPVRPVAGDIRNYLVWTGLHPELITCMGDTLTHLPSLTEVEDLVRHCFSELELDGTLILTLRDYSVQPAGAKDCIPVRRDENRIFLCSLAYHADIMTVEDILYSRSGGRWQRDAGRYTKLRILPEELDRMVRSAGFGTIYSAIQDGMITTIARKEA
jgi:2-polyprenyl-3-methyl-5-hydroxy-6-metoxy-1,4-benzoquinol methylase